MTTLQPKLRYPEFTEDWIEKTIENAIDFLSGFPFKSEDISEDKKGIPLLRGINITEGKIRHSKEIDRYYCGDTKKIEKYFLKKGDLVIGMDGSKVGKNSAIIEEFDAKSILVQRVARLREKKNTSLNFIYHNINSIRFHKYVDEVKTSSGIPHISAYDIKNFVIAFPELPEQTKVANFLSSIDERLKLLEEKKRLLEEYKKGIIQQIFNQEIRFKQDDSSDFPDWEGETLGEIAISIQSGKDKINTDGNYPLYGSTGKIGNCINYNYDGTFILIARVGANAGTINLNSGKFGVTDNTLVFETKVPNDIIFCYFLLSHQNLNKLVFGSGQPLITAGQLKSLKVSLPIIAEQIKIAKFLTAIDEKINKVTQQIEFTQTYKKGLLQQMFC